MPQSNAAGISGKVWLVRARLAMGKCEARQFCGKAEILALLCVAPSLKHALRDGQVVPRVGISGIEFNGPLIFGRGFLEAVLLNERVAEIEMNLVVGGINLRRVAELLLRFGKTFRGSIGETEIVHRIEVVRIDLQRL